MAQEDITNKNLDIYPENRINIQYFQRMSLSVANDWFLGSKPMVCRYVTTSYMGANFLCIYMHF